MTAINRAIFLFCPEICSICSACSTSLCAEIVSLPGFARTMHREAARPQEACISSSGAGMRGFVGVERVAAVVEEARALRLEQLELALDEVDEAASHAP